MTPGIAGQVQIPIDSQSMCVHYYCVLYCSMAIDIGCMITCVDWLTIVGNLVESMIATSNLLTHVLCYDCITSSKEKCTR